VTISVPVDTDAPPPPRAVRRRRTWIFAAVVVAFLAALVMPSISYVQALTYAGDASWSVRTVEWIRDHGGGGIVDVIENWWFSGAPSSAPPDPRSLPAVVPVRSASAPAPLLVLSGVKALPGEGVWSAGTPARDGTPAIFTTFERPDPRHLSVVAGVARIDGARTRTHLIAGTLQPDRAQWPEGATVPASMRPELVATFNSGFKMQDARGGFYADGRTAVPLRDGAASVVIRRDGSATIAQWGRDAVMGPDVVAVRQNLDLVVDGGQPVRGLDVNTGSRWGNAKNQLQYTWRSGVGVDTAGNLVYVGGAEMNLATLAAALARAGAVRGMQLDIHPQMVDLFSYRHDTAKALFGIPLLPTMPGTGRRYLVPDQRDFFAVTVR
jgi:hypothetical protein